MRSFFGQRGTKGGRWAAALVAAGFVAGPMSAEAASVSSTPMAWVSTATRAEPLPGATLLGAVPATMPMHVGVALQLRDKAEVERLVSDEQTITPAQFDGSYGPTSAEAKEVASYLASKGLTGVTVQPGNLLVTASGTARQVEAAFDTTVAKVAWRGRTYFANTSNASVPASLGSVVASVVGLQDIGTMHTFTTGQVPPTANIGNTYTPQDFWKFYDATGTPSGRTTPIALFAEGDVSIPVAQLRAQEAYYHLPKVPVTVVPVGPHSSDTSGNTEWEIDTANSTGMADGVSHLYVYDSTDLTDLSSTAMFVDFAGQHVAKAGSASFGECEYQAYLDGSMVAIDDAALKAAAQGQTLFASSGDQGGFCPFANTNGIGPGGPPDTSYPASSPFFVAVGGTSLFSNANYSYGDEVAWYTSGGGNSSFELQELWQNGIVPATGTVCSSEYALNCGRGVPDIAMDADAIVSPGAYFSGGQPNPQGGTSLASPLALGVWARLESSHGNRLGFAAPLLYGAYGTPGFHDITQGDCEPYPATTGWDFCTGLGSFDVAHMEKYIVPASIAVANVPHPYCTLGTSAPGGAKPNLAGAPLYTGSEAQALDVIAFGMTTKSGNLSGALRVDSLSSGPAGTPEIAGTGDNWYVTWVFHKTTYFVEAGLPGEGVDTSSGKPLPIAYSYGTVTTSPTGGQLYNPIGNATGTFNTADNVITITVPAKDVGSPAVKNVLTATSAQTFASVGTPAGGALESAKTVAGSSYTTGRTC